jgi:D-arabinose 1-dehydrogenase-like Zn-dependent alcohol dehydrogenase
MIASDAMRTIVQPEFGQPDVLRLVDRPVPYPDPGQVVIAVRAFGVCRRDAIVRSGILHRGVKLPLVPGHEFAGVIARVGADVDDWAVGDRVTATQTISCLRCARCREGALQVCERLSTYGHDRDGGYATHAVAEERTLVRVPDSVPFTWAATAGCAMGTAYNGMRMIAGIEPADVVVITGATGGTGIHAVEVARMLHAEVVAVTRRQTAVDALRLAGAAHVIVGSTDRLRDELDARLGRRADLVFDTVGSAVFSGAMRALRHGGTYVFFGQTSRGEVHFSPAAAFLHGINFLSVTGTPIAALERVMHCLDRRLITPHLDVVYGWDAALASHRRLDETDRLGRLVVSLEEPKASTCPGI